MRAQRRARLGTDDERQPQRAVEHEADAADEGEQDEPDAQPQRVDVEALGEQGGDAADDRSGGAGSSADGGAGAGAASAGGGARSTPATVRTFVAPGHRGCPWSIPETSSGTGGRP